MELTILYENNDFLVLNKPPGIVVNKAKSVKGTTVQDWMETKYPQLFKDCADHQDDELNRVFCERSGLAHRLDKDTSGVLLLAKNPNTLQQFMQQFKKRTTTKGYVALVHGHFSSKAGTLKLPMARHPIKRKQFSVRLDGKMTETDYQVLGYYRPLEGYSKGFTLLALAPKTGRTHQLRVVLKHLGHPIVGDQLYLGKRMAEKDRSFFPRHFLHASQLCVQINTGRTRCFNAPLSQDLKNILENLQTI